MRLVVDASVAVKWFNAEEWTDRALALRDDLVGGSIELSAPDHLLYEVGNALWRNPQLSADDCALALEALLNLGVDLRPPSREAAAEAARLARTLGVTFYDSSYIALSELMGAPLVTADGRQGEAARSVTPVIWLWEYGGPPRGRTGGGGGSPPDGEGE